MGGRTTAAAAAAAARTAITTVTQGHRRRRRACRAPPPAETAGVPLGGVGAGTTRGRRRAEDLVPPGRRTGRTGAAGARGRGRAPRRRSRAGRAGRIAGPGDEPGRGRGRCWPGHPNSRRRAEAIPPGRRVRRRAGLRRRTAPQAERPPALADGPEGRGPIRALAPREGEAGGGARRGSGAGSVEVAAASLSPDQPGGIETVAGVHGTGGLDHPADGSEGGGGWDGPVQPAHECGDGRVGREGHVPRHCFGEHERQRVHVGPAVEGVASRLLRGGVPHRADHGAGRLCPGGLGQGAGDPEVGDRQSPVVVEEQVGRFDVTVDEPPPVGVVEAPGRFQPHQDGLRRGEAMAAVEQVAQAAAAEILEHEERAVVLLAPVEHRHDVGVVERRHRPGLGPEAAQEALVGGQGVVEHLDGDAPAQPHVVGDVDVGRRPRTDGREQAVSASDHAPDLVSQAGTGHHPRLPAPRALAAASRTWPHQR